MWKVTYLIVMLSMFFMPLMLTDFVFAEQYVPEQYVPDRLLIKFKDGTSAVQKNSILNNNAANNVLTEIDVIGVKIVRVSEENLDRIQNELSQNPNIEFVEKDFLFEPTIIPNDQKYQFQWHLDKIQASKAWDIHQGSSSIPIAILDTGVDPNHSDLQEKLILGYNFYDNNNDWSDVCGHGTQVAGIASAITNNGIGVAGVTWNNPIIPIRITTDTCWGSYSSMINGIVYAADNGARVANISFRIFDGAILNDAAKYMHDKGGWVVAAAGNTGLFESYSDNPYIISVGATYSSDSITSFSSYGPYVDFSAPGSSITTTAAGNSYSSGSGTSFSSPIVAGLVALVVSTNPSLSSDQVYDILKNSAVDLGDAGYDYYHGWGRVDAYEALKDTQPSTDTESPSVSITDPLNNSVVSEIFLVTVDASDNESVSRVDLYLDDQYHDVDYLEPYGYSLDAGTMTDGSHELKVIAYDTSGNSAVDQITVIVENNVVDTEAPSVSITDPLNNSVVSEIFLVTVDASDNESVSRVDLYVGEQLYDQKTSQPYEFSLDAGTMTDGSNALNVIAYDSSNNIAFDQITVIVENNVVDTEAPSVSITDPLNNSVVSEIFLVTVDASDNESVSRVDLYVGEQLYDQKTSQPYEFSLDAGTMTDGSHELKVIAYDTSGNSAVDQITVIVENNVVDTEAPFVAIITPSDGTTVKGRFLTIVSASDSSGISEVKFYIDGELKRKISNNDNTKDLIEEPPSLKNYGYWWHTYGQTLGDHTITVEVSDRNGNVAISSIIVQFS